MIADNMEPVARTETPHAAGSGRLRSPKALYRVGAGAALTAALLFRRYWSAELLLLRSLGVIGVGPATAPTRAVEWFTLLQSHRLIGLILLDVADLLNYALVGLILLALYAVLRRANWSAMTIAALCGFSGIAVAFASNQAFAMLSLSGRYATAMTETQRSLLLAAGEALLAIHQGTGFYLGLLLVTLSDLIVSLVMLGSGVFSRSTAIVGLVAHVSQLGYFIAVPLMPALVALFPSLAAPFRLAWYILIGRRLLKLASGPREEGSARSAS
jgi:hypothetical protein